MLNRKSQLLQAAISLAELEYFSEEFENGKYWWYRNRGYLFYHAARGDNFAARSLRHIKATRDNFYVIFRSL